MAYKYQGTPPGRPSSDKLVSCPADMAGGPSGRPLPRYLVVTAAAFLATACAQNAHQGGAETMMEGAKNTSTENTVPPPEARATTQGAQHVPTETTYMGRTIHLTTILNANGLWTGSARLADEPDRVLDADGEFATPNEARNAALSRAVSEIDRERRFRGKP